MSRARTGGALFWRRIYLIPFATLTSTPTSSVPTGRWPRRMPRRSRTSVSAACEPKPPGEPWLKGPSGQKECEQTSAPASRRLRFLRGSSGEIRSLNNSNQWAIANSPGTAGQCGSTTPPPAQPSGAARDRHSSLPSYTWMLGKSMPSSAGSPSSTIGTSVRLPSPRASGGNGCKAALFAARPRA